MYGIVTSTDVAPVDAVLNAATSTGWVWSALDPALAKASTSWLCPTLGSTAREGSALCRPSSCSAGRPGA